MTAAEKPRARILKALKSLQASERDVPASDVVGEAEVDLYDGLSALYNLRKEQVVSWTDPVLLPETRIRLEQALPGTST